MTEYASLTRALYHFISHDEIFASVALLVIVLICLILPWFLLAFGHEANKSRYFLSSFPVQKAANVYSGLTMLQGTAEPIEPLVSYLTERPCVWYSFVIQEQWKKSLTTVHVDRKGRKRTRKEYIYGWSPLYADEQSVKFHLRDESGKVAVDPSGAKIEPIIVMNKECGVDDPQYYCNAPEGCIPRSTLRRRFIEEIIPLNAEISVLGTAEEGKETILPEIVEGDRKGAFRISTKNKEEYTRRLVRKAWLLQGCGFLVLMLPALLAWLISSSAGLHPGHYMISALLLAFYAVTCALLWKKPALKAVRRARRRAREAREVLEGLLEERKALIPELYYIVDDYCRGGLIPEETPDTLYTKLREGSLTFDSLIREHPQLSTGSIFMSLTRNRHAVEQRIDLAMRSFNEYAAYYNGMISRYPGFILRFIANKKRMPLSYEMDMSRYEPVIEPPSAGEPPSGQTQAG